MVYETFPVKLDNYILVETSITEMNAVSLVTSSYRVYNAVLTGAIGSFHSIAHQWSLMDLSKKSWDPGDQLHLMKSLKMCKSTFSGETTLPFQSSR